MRKVSEHHGARNVAHVMPQGTMLELFTALREGHDEGSVDADIYLHRDRGDLGDDRAPGGTGAGHYGEVSQSSMTFLTTPHCARWASMSAATKNRALS